MTTTITPTLKVPVVTEIARSRLADLICCALEGGSTYWCSRCSVDDFGDREWAHEAIADGKPFSVWPDVDGEAVNVENSDERLIQTLALMAEEPQHWVDFLNDNEDADTGDCFFQLLCFGEVVYG